MIPPPPHQGLIVVVTGGRKYANAEHVRQILSLFPITLLVHGNATGADALADHYATSNTIAVKAFPADWERYGDSAGPRRNREMAQFVGSQPGRKLCIAFPGSFGTKHMMDAARAAGVNVMETFPGKGVV